ncbi:DUF4266 domain-containing protein [Pontibacter ramchanderi]|uniref:Uncharacterized protein DUF4266 n=1 Tax=Pontibacter ramchanderi TaxID=1179743 RepID=A0A2N3V0M8_9BACT|nr:DUF4266 domain-containing protein [Pontibacter ramchanderi]PKV75174.1 uncharacterized protein DUF4266 [Pontibacter ramchanderi]
MTHTKVYFQVAGALLSLVLLSGCEVVKPYQKTLLNEEEMKLSARKLERFETNFQSYREGASGANGGKVGGGCGCN